MRERDGGSARANDLGVALRTWRRRADPATAGLPIDRARRVAGLRREELARLAGMSVDYVVRLEQGRAASPSPQILLALARALRLSPDERRHLFLLAGRLAPAPERVSAHLTPGVLRLLDRLDGSPVAVYDAAWTPIAWNPLHAALAGDGDGDLNVAWRHFTGASSRVRHTPAQTERFEAAMVADLRAATARFPGDARLRRLIADLRRHSPRFAGLWASHEVGAHVADRKTIHHPDVGDVRLDCDVLTVPDSDVHVVVCTAEPGSEAAGKLRLLSALTEPPRTGPAPTAPRRCVAAR
ncbi:helix-turn-helix domain-containing protein [Actinomadura sp. WMMB 499]|uniref:helix-turn-helix domain-containing protein n=1 Tax=Actinomadura sp. WMMB 499 TaxID=1219491 RepID=UPI001246CEEE|nr:helix-turn-helix transcriptional regulator [Actinomadura sp. WMMB 499]QFG24105.1 helix-turn-helix transcriptional regulator [Actinomadura sp. WMMB 499]